MTDKPFFVTSPDGRFTIYETSSNFQIINNATKETKGMGDGVDMYFNPETHEPYNVGTPEFYKEMEYDVQTNSYDIFEGYFGAAPAEQPNEKPQHAALLRVRLEQIREEVVALIKEQIESHKLDADIHIDFSSQLMYCPKFTEDGLEYDAAYIQAFSNTGLTDDQGFIYQPEDQMFSTAFLIGVLEALETGQYESEEED